MHTLGNGPVAEYAQFRSEPWHNTFRLVVALTTRNSLDIVYAAPCKAICVECTLGCLHIGTQNADTAYVTASEWGSTEMYESVWALVENKKTRT